jgi:uncharacterized membrane protein
MPLKRSSPQRGLLAGLLALVTFVSGAVALTARRATATATQATAAGQIHSEGDRRETAFHGHER